MRLLLTPLLLLGCWAAWWLGGVLLAWLGLEALDLPGRLALVFLALSLAEAALAHLPARWREPH